MQGYDRSSLSKTLWKPEILARLLKTKRLGLIILWPILLSLACAGGWPLAGPASTPTPAGMVINIEVTIVSAVETITPTATFAPLVPPTPASIPTLVPVETATPTQTLPPTETPTPEPTPTPIGQPVSPADTPILPPTSVAASPLTTTLVTSPTLTQTIPTTGTAFGVIALIEPQSGLNLPANVGGLELKWQWSGANGCRVPENYGFEVRIWPAVTGYGPLGVMDAVKEQKDVFCDPETGIFKYQVVNLKSTPGVKATGAGNFLWDVAYVQLKPYYTVLLTSLEQRLFAITTDYTGSFDPFGEDLDCTDFPSWAEAQAVFIKAGGPAKDPHQLDPDGNGVPCEELK